jgi:hypothetical protein
VDEWHARSSFHCYTWLYIMGKVIPRTEDTKTTKRAKRVSRIYTHVQNVDSHIDRVTNSLEQLLFSSEQESENLSRKRVMLGVFSLALLTILGATLSPKGKAEISTFYPSSCLGGWSNPHNVEGEPQTKTDSTEVEFTKDNSAILLETTHADIYCGNFVGKVEENTKPTKILISLSWSRGETPASSQKVVGESFASSTGEILDAASSTEVSFTLKNSEDVATSSGETIQEATTTSEKVDTESAPTTSEESLIQKSVDVVQGAINVLLGGVDVSSDSGKEVNGLDKGAPTKTEINTTQEGDVLVPSQTEQDAPRTEEAPTSFLNEVLQKFAGYFVKTVFAEEVASSSQDVLVGQGLEGDSSIVTTTTSVTTTTTPIFPTKEYDSLPGNTEMLSGEEDPTSISKGEIVPVPSVSTNDEVATSGALRTEDSAGTSSDVVLGIGTDDQAENNFLEVLYTFDGTTWNSLGKVNEASMNYRTFEIPATATTSWSKLGQLQIKVQSLQRIDPTPTVYLDAIKADVLYETVIVHEHPDFSRDTILKDKTDDGVRVVNIINSDTNANEIWYTTVDTQGSYGVAPGAWVQVNLYQTNSSYKLLDIYGQNIFWVDEVEKILWASNLQKETNDGIGLAKGASTTVSFTKTNGEEWVFEYNSSTKVSLARIKQQ